MVIAPTTEQHRVQSFPHVATAQQPRAAPPPPAVSRRVAHLQLATVALGSTWIAASLPANAGLVQYPLTSLRNTYFLLRAGESDAEAQGYALTNPVAKTSMDNALSAEGRRQVVRAHRRLQADSACQDGCLLWPGMALNSYQTAEILAGLWGLGRHRIVPEFSKLDARGAGALDRGPAAVVAAELAEGDALSADWRPPRGTDGTPNESAVDVMTRGRELLSLLETQYSGDTLLLISPDSDNLSVLQAAVMGVDLRGHRRFALAAGEYRRLELGTAERDDSPVRMPCPRPPLCK